MNLDEFKKDITNLFTNDGLELLTSYLLSLRTQMSKSELSTDQQDIVLNGIFEFITEFSLTHQNSKLNFSDSLNLIDDIGSPSEIIHSFDFNEENEEDSFLCPSCKWENNSNSVYCEYCGKLLSKVDNKKLINKNLRVKEILNNISQKINQDIIDYPYSRSYALSTIIFTAVVFFIRYVSNVSQAQSTYKFINVLFEGIMLSFVSTLFPSIVVALIVGFILDSEFKSEKSLKFRYDKIIKHFEENVEVGLILILMGSSFLCVFFALGSETIITPLVFIIWFIAIISSILIMIYYDKKSLKPTNLNITQLSKLKLIIDKNNNKKFIFFNLKTIPLTLILSFLSLILNYIIPSSIIPVASALVVSIWFLIYLVSYFIIINGFLFIKLNSWRDIRKNYLKET